MSELRSVPDDGWDPDHDAAASAETDRRYAAGMPAAPEAGAYSSIGPVIDRDLEQRLVGALVTGRGMDERAVQRGLRPEHLAGPLLRRTLEAILGLQDHGVAVDRVTIRGELVRLGVTASDAQRLTEQLPSDGLLAMQVDSYVDRVRDLHRRRQEAEAGQLLQQAAERGDPDLRARALAMLDEDTAAASVQTHMTGAQLAELVGNYLAQPAAQRDPEFATPWLDVNEALDGGLRRGEMLVIAGHSSHNKSTAADGIIDVAARAGRRVTLYMSEMTHLDRALRLVASLARTGLRKLRRRLLMSRDMDAITQALNSLHDLPVTFVNAAGWTVEEVCRDIRRARPDLAVVDHLHDFPYNDERDLARHVTRLQNVASSSTLDHAGTALVVCAQMNESAQGDGNYPRRPTLKGIKGSGQFRTTAAVILTTYMEDGGEGSPGLDGQIRLLKVRNGTPGVSVDVQLDVAAMRLIKREAA